MEILRHLIHFHTENHLPHLAQTDFLVTQRRFLDASLPHRATLSGIQNHHI